MKLVKFNDGTYGVRRLTYEDLKEAGFITKRY